MSFRELRTLVAVADQGSITAAAEILCLSVPAVSAHVIHLEQRYKTSLMDRRRKPARLNEAGQCLASKAREILQLHEQLHEAVGSVPDISGTLVLGASVTVLTNVVPLALLALREAHPKLIIRMQYSRPWFLLEQLSHGEIDAAIVSEPRGYTAGVTWTQFGREPIVVIAPPHARGRTDEALLREFPYIRYSRQFWVSREIDAHLAQRGLALPDTMEVDSREAIEVMVKHGLGVSIVPQSDSTIANFYGLKTVPLGRPPLMRAVGLAQRTSSPKQRLIAALFDTLRHSMPKYGRRRPARPMP